MTVVTVVTVMTVMTSFRGILHLIPQPSSHFRRGRATLHLAVSVGRSVGRLQLTNMAEFRAVFALRPLPNRSRLCCPVSGLVADSRLSFGTQIFMLVFAHL